MDTLHSALKLIKKGCLMASVDLKDAYFSVPIHVSDQKYLKFYWDNTLYKFTVFPNGLACCPRLFTKLLKPVLAHLHDKGLTSTMFIDDTLLLGDTMGECLLNVKETVNLFSKLGFVVHPTKSVLEPKTNIVYLGFMIDSEEMRVSLTEEKKCNIKMVCEDILEKQVIKIRDLASIIGKLVASFPGVKYGPLWYRNLEENKKTALQRSKGNFEKKVWISDLAQDELKWWTENIMTVFNTIEVEEPCQIIYTDASLKGWGCTTGLMRTGGEWTAVEALDNINVLELRAVFMALNICTKNRSNCHFRIMTDNITTMTCINKMGTSHSLACNKETKKIWQLCAKKNIWISAAYITSKENMIADYESRNVNLDMEWMINKELLKVALEILNFKPNYDLFASRNNHQYKLYASFKEDPGADRVDSFNMYWGDKKMYAFPPFCIIPRVIQKIRRDKATGVLVVPFWKNQIWYSEIGKMLVERPVLISARKNLLQLPAHPEKTHKMEKSLRLLCCKISGKDTKIKEFQKCLPAYLQLPGDKEQSETMTVILKNGNDMQIRKTSILFHRL